MAILETALDPRAPSFLDNRSSALAALTLLELAHAQARDGGGEREVTRHHARGKLLPRERVELLIDRDTALLELAATAGSPAGVGVVTAIGLIEGVECMLIGNDPTVHAGGLTEAGKRKAARAIEIASRCRLPIIFLWESILDSASVPTPVEGLALAAVFGPGAGPAPVVDHLIVLGGQDEQAIADAIALDEHDALRLIRESARRLFQAAPTTTAIGIAPRHESDDLLAVTRTDLREVIARILDGSEFEELRPHRGTALVTGFGVVHGHTVAILGGTAVELDQECLHKGLDLIRKADLAGVPVLVFAAGIPPAPAEFPVPGGSVFATGGTVAQPAKAAATPAAAAATAVAAASDATAAGITTRATVGAAAASATAGANLGGSNLGVAALAGAAAGVAGSTGTAATGFRGGDTLLGRALADAAQVTILLDASAPTWATVGRGFRFRWPGPSDEIFDGVIDPRDTRTVLGICLSVLRGRP